MVESERQRDRSPVKWMDQAQTFTNTLLQTLLTEKMDRKPWKTKVNSFTWFHEFMIS